MYYGETNLPIELSFTAIRDVASHRRRIKDFADLEVDVVFQGPRGRIWRVPAFWAGDNVFRVRFAAPKPGHYTYQAVCERPKHIWLHGQKGQVEVTAYQGKNPLYLHGGIQVAKTKRTLEHADGTPFFWLGDTWWMGLCKRLRWPGDFRALVVDRVAKGFTVIQIVAGLYPDMPAFDERGANEAGFPWEKGFTRINPAYFDMADLRIDFLVKSGLVPCIVGCWGYYLPWMGVDKMKKHWRYLVARYGAYPVVWCLAGEGQMPYYLSDTKEQDTAFQKKNWTELGRYVRSIDPFHRLVTIHPGTSARHVVEDQGVLDFDMLQTGHGDRRSLPNTVKLVTESYHSEPRMPVVNGEVCYEGIGEACRQEVQRLMFWVCMLSGAAGFTYGANGIWQVNTREKPFGPSPHGMSWGDTPWEDAYQLPGSRQLGMAKRLLEGYQWWRFEPHPEWVEPHWTPENYMLPYAAGIPGQVRIVYAPLGGWPKAIKHIEPKVPYRAYLFNPASGDKHNLGKIKPDAIGDWPLPQRMPIYQDWVVVLERA